MEERGRRVQRRTVPDKETRIESARRPLGLSLTQQMAAMSESAKVGVPKPTSCESWWTCHSVGKAVMVQQGRVQRRHWWGRLQGHEVPAKMKQIIAEMCQEGKRTCRGFGVPAWSRDRAVEVLGGRQWHRVPVKRSVLLLGRGQ